MLEPGKMVQNPFTQTPAKIAVLGLGYVGLPLAVAFASGHDVVGFDLSAERVAELSRHQRQRPTLHDRR